MLYFFHHYELPMILQQAQLQQLIYRNHTQPPTRGGTQQQQQQDQTPVAPSHSTPLGGSHQQQRLGDQHTQSDYIEDLSQLDNFSGIARIADVFLLR